jgi:hypothetical protein
VAWNRAPGAPGAVQGRSTILRNFAGRVAVGQVQLGLERMPAPRRPMAGAWQLDPVVKPLAREGSKGEPARGQAATAPESPRRPSEAGEQR